MPPLVTWSTEGPVTALKLNRPDQLNAMDEAMAEEFRAACGKIAKEKSRVVIVTGEGRAFSSGGDLGFIEKNQVTAKAKLPAIMRRFYGSFLALRDLPQATIAQINGPAVGAGLCLAFACDLRTTLADAKMGFNFVRLGLNPGLAAFPLATAVLGPGRARELILTGRFFTGSVLASWGGAVLSAETAEQLRDETAALAAEIASHSPFALSLAKREMTLGAPLEAFLDFEAKGQAEAFKHKELAEGLQALRERRAPLFR
jgi:enoyl-CoA hydratase/carnithine racemase